MAQLSRSILVLRPTILAFSFFATTTLVGCSTSTFNMPEPRIAIPADWSQIGPTAAPTEPAEYWKRLGDPLLVRFVERAVVANRDIMQSIARVDQARAALRQARAGWLPSVSATGSATRDVGDFARDGVFFSAGLDAAWELDLFGQIGSDVAAAQAELLAAGYSLGDLQRLVIGQVAISTINARALSEQLRIARETLAFQDENLQIARWRNQAGLVSSLDVEQARTQRAQTAATIPQLETSLAATANAISTLIGEPPGDVYRAFVAEGGTAVPAPALLQDFAAPVEVLRRRPDVRAAEAGLAASTARIGIARAQLLPLVRLTGTLGTGPVRAEDLFEIVTGGLVAGVSQLIFDGGRTQAQVDSAEAAARGALAAWEQAILVALEDVESAAVDQRKSAERVAIFDEAVDAANNSAILARSQYQAGLVDFRTLLTAENQLLSARNQKVGAEADRATAFVRLTQALGGGWDGALAAGTADDDPDGMER